MRVSILGANEKKEKSGRREGNWVQRRDMMQHEGTYGAAGVELGVEAEMPGPDRPHSTEHTCRLRDFFTNHCMAWLQTTPRSEAMKSIATYAWA